VQYSLTSEDKAENVGIYFDFNSDTESDIILDYDTDLEDLFNLSDNNPINELKPG
jgi:hypothetical protein